jgi:hypothetical protein
MEFSFFLDMQMLFAALAHLHGGPSLDTLMVMILSRVRVIIDGVGLIVGFIKL